LADLYAGCNLPLQRTGDIPTYRCGCCAGCATHAAVKEAEAAAAAAEQAQSKLEAMPKKGKSTAAAAAAAARAATAAAAAAAKTVQQLSESQKLVRVSHEVDLALVKDLLHDYPPTGAEAPVTLATLVSCILACCVGTAAGSALASAQCPVPLTGQCPVPSASFHEGAALPCWLHMLHLTTSAGTHLMYKH
jgi:hypothetical protein